MHVTFNVVTLAVTLAVMAVVIWTVYRYGPWRRL
jgi:hypothetical protein